MIKQFKAFNVLQYVFIVAYLFIMLFCSLGTLHMDMDIYYIKAPENGFYGDFDASLNFDVVGKMFFTVISIVELILLHFSKLKLASLNIVLCSIRTLPSLLYCLTALLLVFSNGDTVSISVTVFGYVMLLLCVASLICHIKNRLELVHQKNVL